VGAGTQGRRDARMHLWGRGTQGCACGRAAGAFRSPLHPSDACFIIGAQCSIPEYRIVVRPYRNRPPYLREYVLAVCTADKPDPPAMEQRTRRCAAPFTFNPPCRKATPKVSKGRAESPLVAPAGAMLPLALNPPCEKATLKVSKGRAESPLVAPAGAMLPLALNPPCEKATPKVSKGRAESPLVAPAGAVLRILRSAGSIP
jgi:hypothetical protein